MRALNENEMGMVAGGLMAVDGGFPVDTEGGDGGGGGGGGGGSGGGSGGSSTDTGGGDTYIEQATAISQILLSGINEGLYESSFAENAFQMTDLAQVSSFTYQATYDNMVNDCTYWEDVGPGTHTPSPQGAVFDVRYINWSAYDGGGSLSCQQAVTNLFNSLHAGNKLSIDPNYHR